MTDLYERLLLLKKTPLFSEVYTDELEAIAEALEEDHFLKDDIIFRQYDPSDRMYILVGGKVGISWSSESSTDGHVVELGAGDCFGEMGLLDGLPRSASCHALEDTDVLVMEKAALHNILLRYPEIAVGMLRHLSLMVRSANAASNDPHPAGGLKE
jgi:CRP-like cAMP-binding protein